MDKKIINGYWNNVIQSYLSKVDKQKETKFALTTTLLSGITGLCLISLKRFNKTYAIIPGVFSFMMFNKYEDVYNENNHFTHLAEKYYNKVKNIKILPEVENVPEYLEQEISKEFGNLEPELIMDNLSNSIDSDIYISRITEVDWDTKPSTIRSSTNNIVLTEYWGRPYYEFEKNDVITSIPLSIAKCAYYSRKINNQSHYDADYHCNISRKIWPEVYEMIISKN